jgi:hypothetical protein
MSEVLAKISIGELLDKLSILEIKKNKIKDKEKLKYIEDEYNILHLLSSDFLLDFTVRDYYNELSSINNELWDIEDSIRIKENNSEFDSVFIDLARKVYITNDRRYEIKNKINKKTESSIQEQKGYKYE